MSCLTGLTLASPYGHSRPRLPIRNVSIAETSNPSCNEWLGGSDRGALILKGEPLLHRLRIHQCAMAVRAKKMEQWQQDTQYMPLIFILHYLNVCHGTCWCMNLSFPPCFSLTDCFYLPPHLWILPAGFQCSSWIQQMQSVQSTFSKQCRQPSIKRAHTSCMVEAAKFQKLAG